MYGDALTTTDRIKDRLGIDHAGFNNVIDRLILAVTARIQTTCGRRFVQGTYTHEIHDGCDIWGSPRSFLILKNAPVQTITSIQYQAGTNSNPNWQTISEDDYHADYMAGLVRFPGGLPHGTRNIRVTYTGGFSGYSIGVANFWVFNITPTGTVDGSNRTFALPEEAEQVVVYADGLREAASNVTFEEGADEFTLAEGRAPFTTIAADYLRANETVESDYYLPADLVEVCEAVVIRIFKKRESEGRASETFGESSIVWNKSYFSEEDLATIRNYRRGYNL